MSWFADIDADLFAVNCDLPVLCGEGGVVQRRFDPLGLWQALRGLVR